jgi:hypothetical protein
MLLFKNDVYSGLKYCPNLLETVVPRVLNRKFGDFSLINVDCKRRKLTLRWMRFGAGDIDILNGRSVSVNMIGHYLIVLLHNSETV